MNERWRTLAAAGHSGQVDIARDGLTDDDPVARELALGALERCDALTDLELVDAFSDEAAGVRRRAVSIAAGRPHIDLTSMLDDPDATVAEQTAWSLGEHEIVPDHSLLRLIDLAGASPTPLVREAAIAALGAIGDERGLPAILQGCTDQPAIRRRAVLALAPFDSDDAEAAIDRALTDRDWQVRQAAEDLRRG
jgi:HEAT repeat protein